MYADLQCDPHLTRFFFTSLVLVSMSLCSCAHAPEVDYALYDLNQAGATRGSPKLISGSSPGDGAITYSPAGSYILIADAPVAAAPAAGASDTKGTAGNSTAALAHAVNSGLKSGAAGTTKLISTATDLAKESFSVTPGASTQYEVAITPNETFYFKPNISATFAAGTSRLTQIGADSQDNSASMITTAVGTAVSLATVIGVGAVDQPAEKIPLPYVLDLTPADVENCIYKADGAPGKPISSANIKEQEWCGFDTKLTSWKYRLEIVSGRMGRPLFSDTDSTSFFSSAKAPTSTRLFPFSPCLQVFLHVRYLGDGSNGADVVVSPALTIADPSRVETYLIPAKGTIALDSVCGANITPQNYTPTTNLDDVKALVDGIAQLKSKQATTSTSKATGK